MQENKRVVIAKRSSAVIITFIMLLAGVAMFTVMLVYNYNLEYLILDMVCAVFAVYELYNMVSVPSEMIVYKDGKLIIYPSKHDKIEISPKEIDSVTHRQLNWWYGYGKLRINVNGKEIVLREVAGLESVTAELQRLKNEDLANKA